MISKEKELVHTNSDSNSNYDNNITKKIKEFDRRVTAIDKTVDDLFDLTEKMLLNIGELK